MRLLYNPVREFLSYVGLVDVPIISGALISKIQANTDILTLRLIGTDRDHRSAMNLSRFGQSFITGLRRILSN